MLDELIYKFLIQSGFPRSSIVSSLPGNGGEQADGANRNGSISYVVVDPTNADYLSVIAVVGAVDEAQLSAEGAACRQYASRLDKYDLQCFVIRVDLDASSADQQILFYRVRQNNQLAPLTVQNFPDIESLRVSRMLRVKALPTAPEVVDVVEEPPTKAAAVPLKIFLPAMLLLLAAIVNLLSGKLVGAVFFDASVISLFIAAAFLFTIGLSLRYYRQ